ncbi:MAG: hypothetical protein MI863_00910 [Desulfobacterales bacterium]|nr:hypothetical protein [Desulfobacterales bacterium]
MNIQGRYADQWEEIIRDLETRKTKAREMGGPQKVAAHRAKGRCDARQRISLLLDQGSFVELGTLVGAIPRDGLPAVAADGLVAGFGQIFGRPVLVGSEDFTSKGGSIGHGTHAKRMRLASLAAQENIPLVMILEGAGERVTNMLQRQSHAPNDLQGLADLAGRVPTVAAVMGASAGHGALTAMLTDFTVMTRGSAFFSAGPPLVAGATGEQVTKEQLGGVDVHVETSGVIYNAYENEHEAFDNIRKYLGYFPLNAWQRPPVHTSDDGRRELDQILDLIPPEAFRPYDMGVLARMLCDPDSLFEVQPAFGASIITAYGRIAGRPVAIVANQPMVRAGTVDRAAAQKAARFIEIADNFHFPFIFLADNPGIMAGTAAEREGTIRSASRMYYAQSRIRGTKIHVGVRKAFGFGSSLMAMNPYDDQTLTIAFPGATLGAMPAKGGGKAAGADSEAREALKAAETSGAYSAADGMNYDEVIDPRQLRNVLLSALEMSENRLVENVEPRPGGIRP